MRTAAGYTSLNIALACVLLGAAVTTSARAASTTIEASFNGQQPEMPKRLLRDGMPTTCAVEAFPGTFDQSALWQRFRFCNSAATEQCFTAIFDEGDCRDDVHIMAYVDSFDPDDLATNYAGDTGASDSMPFSFVVPAGAQFFIVAQTNFPDVDCSFGFTVNTTPCSAVAPLLSGVGLAVAAAALLVVGAFMVMRRSRQALPAFALCAVITAFAGPAAAPLAADPTPGPSRACALSCSAAYRACAKDQCDSSASDQDVPCLQGCRQDYEDCLEACS
ncbi:MAG: hypothetical protein AB7V27_18535 [Candidatus Binatia bacterium]